MDFLVRNAELPEINSLEEIPKCSNTIFTVWVIRDKWERCVNRKGLLSADNSYMDNVRGQDDVKHKVSMVVLLYIL